MKKVSLAVLVSFLVFSGLALASQSEEPKERPSTMEEMMKNDRQGEHGGGGMMRMMKMMDQCAAMMESHGSEGAKESQQQ